MPRYRFDIEYDGSGFAGWQRQENGLTIQQVMEEAIYAFSGEAAVLHAAGRTDAGVHATGQVAHCDLVREWPLRILRDATNFHLRPHRVAVIAAVMVPSTFHARFSAIGRAYLYRILNRSAPPVLERQRVWHVPSPLNLEVMQAAALLLTGRHDFTSFRASQCQAASPIKTLDQLSLSRVGEEIRIVAKARSFLHHQVRNMVGTLKQVGDGRWPPERISQILDACNRSAAGPTAPPEGLYLTEVQYPPGHLEDGGESAGPIGVLED